MMSFTSIIAWEEKKDDSQDRQGRETYHKSRLQR
jgi:hypothetical protein